MIHMVMDGITMSGQQVLQQIQLFLIVTHYFQDHLDLLLFVCQKIATQLYVIMVHGNQRLAGS